MRALLFLSGWLAMGLSHTAQAEEALFDAPPLNDAELAEARAGFVLPSGIKVDFGAIVTTSVDGARLLETALQINAEGIAAAVSAAEGVTVSIAGNDPAAGQDGNGRAPGANTGTGSSSGIGEFLQASVELPDLVVRHLIGRQISSLIVNTADNRVVDNQVAINLRLDDVQPLSLGSIGFRVQALSLDAALSRLP